MKVIRSMLPVFFVLSTVVVVAAVCPYENKGSVRRRTTQISRTLQWGSQHPDFISLLSAADFYSASFAQPDSSSTATIAVSSEGTRSVMNLQNGDWLRYSVGIPEQGDYTLSLRISATAEGGSVQVVSVDTRAVIATLSDLPLTGDPNVWTTVSTNLTLPVGMHRLELLVDRGGWSLQWLNLVPVEVVVASPLMPVAAPVASAPAPTLVAAPVTSAPVVVSAPAPTLAAPIVPSVVIPMTPEAMPPLFNPVMVPVASPVAAPIAAPSMSPVMASVPTPVAVPVPAAIPVMTPLATPVATPVSAPASSPVNTSAIPMLPPVTIPNECSLYINASNYASMSGVYHEAGTDYVGWLDPGDWIAYNVTSLPPGTYQLDTLIASPEGDGSFLLVDARTLTPLMMQSDMPVTGSWTNWQIVSTVFAQPIATTTTTTAPSQLELRVYSDGWNLKSLCFRETTAMVPPFQVPGPPTMEPTMTVTDFSRTDSEGPVMVQSPSAASPAALPPSLAYPLPPPTEAPVRPPHDCSSPF